VELLFLVENEWKFHSKWIRPILDIEVWVDQKTFIYFLVYLRTSGRPLPLDP
jgi:hypothetical protein